MTANENPAASNDGDSERIAGPNNRYVDYIAPPLSTSAKRWLSEWCDAIADGSVSLGQLPLPVVSIYLLGYAHAEQRYACSHGDELARARHERDLWYFVANNPGKRPGDFMRAHTDLLWQEGVAA